jgi:hypothetical protein
MGVVEILWFYNSLSLYTYMNIYSYGEEKIEIYRAKVKDKDEDMRNCNGRRPECAGRPEVRKVPILCDRRFGDNGV